MLLEQRLELRHAGTAVCPSLEAGVDVGHGRVFLRPERFDNYLLTRAETGAHLAAHVVTTLVREAGQKTGAGITSAAGVGSIGLAGKISVVPARDARGGLLAQWLCGSTPTCGMCARPVVRACSSKPRLRQKNAPGMVVGITST